MLGIVDVSLKKRIWIWETWEMSTKIKWNSKNNGEHIFHSFPLVLQLLGSFRHQKEVVAHDRNLKHCHRRLGTVKTYMCSKTRQINAKRKKLLLLWNISPRFRMALSQNCRQLGEYPEGISLALTTFHQRQDISQNSDLQTLGSLFLFFFFSFVFPHSGCFAFCLTTSTFQKGKRYHWVVWTACSMKYLSFGWMYKQIYCQIPFSNKIYIQFFHSPQHQDLWTYGTHFFPVMQTLTESMQTVRIWCHYLNLKNIKIWRSHYSV